VTAARSKGPPAKREAKPDKKHWTLVGLAWALIAVAAVILWMRAVQVPSPTDDDEFNRSARQLRSDALEAAMLARQLAAGQLTAQYAKAQHELLARDLEDVRQELDKPPPKGRADSASRALEGADQLAALLKQVPSRMADASAMTQLAAQEEAIAGRLNEVARP
jgi:hypothetical protein